MDLRTSVAADPVPWRAYRDVPGLTVGMGLPQRKGEKSPHESFSWGQRLAWRPQGDLNPCYRRERPVSWTELDDGDLAGRLGFEPRLTESESAVLPLNDRPERKPSSRERTGELSSGNSEVFWADRRRATWA